MAIIVIDQMVVYSLLVLEFGHNVLVLEHDKLTIYSVAFTREFF